MDKNCEKYKYQCEIRYLLKYRAEHGLEEFRNYLANPNFKNRLQKIKKDFTEQWIKGNRGNLDDWR